MIKYIIAVFFLFFSSCNTNETSENKQIQMPSPIENSFFCDNDIQGNFTVEVIRLESSVSRTFTDEDITLVSNGFYKTTTTAIFSLTQMPDAINAGFYFITNCDNGTITVPTQSLAQTYSNKVRGFPENNGIDGTIIDENHFELFIEVTHFITIPHYRYKAVYTRNN
jgi:hypothetical protein